MPEPVEPQITDPTDTPPPGESPPPPPTEPATLAGEYDLGDRDPDPDFDSVPPPSAKATTPPKPVESPKPVEPVKPKPSAALLRRARDLGIPDVEAETADPDHLEDLVYHLNRQALQQARPAAAAPAPATPPAEEPIDLGIKEEDYDASIIGVLKNQARELKALKAQLSQFGQHVTARENETRNQTIDRVFAEHEAKSPGRFSAKTRAEFKGDEPEYQRRMAVLTLAGQTKGPGTLEQKLARAVETLYGEARPEPEPEPAAPSRKEEWRRGGLARPTQRASKEPPGERKALKTAASLMKEMGLGDEEEAGLDGFIE